MIYHLQKIYIYLNNAVRISLQVQFTSQYSCHHCLNIWNSVILISFENKCSVGYYCHIVRHGLMMRGCDWWCTEEEEKGEESAKHNISSQMKPRIIYFRKQGNIF